VLQFGLKCDFFDPAQVRLLAMKVDAYGFYECWIEKLFLQAASQGQAQVFSQRSSASLSVLWLRFTKSHLCEAAFRPDYLQARHLRPLGTSTDLS